jgi:hypothetical protein
MGAYVLLSSQASVTSLASVQRSYVVLSYVAKCDEGLTEWAQVTGYEKLVTYLTLEVQSKSAAAAKPALKRPGAEQLSSSNQDWAACSAGRGHYSHRNRGGGGRGRRGWQRQDFY